MAQTPAKATAPTCLFTAHPAIGLKPGGSKSATLFGDARPPFWWMRLSPSQQQARTSLFYRTLLSEIATYPMLDVRATFKDGETARAIASSAGLSVEGCTVSGQPPDPAAVVRLVDRPWQGLRITSGSLPLLDADPSEARVNLWLDEQQAAKIGKALAPTLVAEGADASPRRTWRAALLIALNWIILAGVILVGALVYRASEDFAPTLVAIVMGIATAVLIGLPLQAIGKRFQRRYYDNLA